jgi:hypothetical protein
MRKLSAILLIGLFAFSQYARQLGYLECKFSNTLKLRSVKCDCEKLAGIDKQDTNQTSSPKTHTLIYPDEFFSISGEILSALNFNGFKTKLNPLPNEDECEGNSPGPWQPPNA